MPILNNRTPAYKPQPDLQAQWSNFRKGLNLILRPTELGRDELAQADNIMLTGSGVPTGRWGTSSYFSVNATGSVRGLASFANSASATNEIIGLTDQGYLAKKNGTTSTQINGQSYPSGSVVRGEQLGGYTYFVSKDRPMTRYNGATLSVFATIPAPIPISATNFSGVSGPAQWSWKINTVAISGGDTEGSTNITLANLPQDLSQTTVHLRWTQPSTATYSAFQIYRGQPGDETLLATVGAGTFLYADQGAPASDTVFAPTSNTTGGVNSNFILKVRDRLVVVPQDDPTKILISGRFPNEYKFNWADGGGYVYIDPKSGDDITGLATQPGSDNIIVFKNNSSYSVRLDTITLGNYTILDPQYQPVSTSIGCSSHDSIQTVENDVFYFGKKGLYVIGYEPNFLNIIRTNEISARIRPYLETLSDDDYENCCSMYINNKYVLSFPNRKEMIVYDRERGAFVGPWKLPWGISKMLKYFDSTGTEKWVLGSSESNNTYTFESSVNSDNGTTITKTLRTNKEPFNSWSTLKIIKLFYVLFRRVTGTVTVNLLMEDRTGATTTVKSFDISGSAVSGSLGWGIDSWGTASWGTSDGEVTIAGDELYKWTQLFKSGRVIQVEVSCTASNSNFELLDLRMTANSQGDGSLASSSRV